MQVRFLRVPTVVTPPAVIIKSEDGLGGSHELGGRWNLTPLLCALAGPSSLLAHPDVSLKAGREQWETYQKHFAPSSANSTCALVTLLLEHKADVDVVALQVGAEGCERPVPPLATASSSPRISWASLVLRGKQEGVAEQFDLCLEHTKTDRRQVHILRHRLQFCQLESELQTALSQQGGAEETHAAVQRWAVSVEQRSEQQTAQARDMAGRAKVPEGSGAWVEEYSRSCMAVAKEMEAMETFGWAEVSTGTIRLLDAFLSCLVDDSAALSTLASLFSRAKCPPDLRFANGSTMLLRAAAANRCATAKVLLEARADCLAVHEKTKDTALHLAVSESALETVQLLLRHEDRRHCLYARNADGKRPLECVSTAKKAASSAAAKAIRSELEAALAEEKALQRARDAAAAKAANNQVFSKMGAEGEKAERADAKRAADADASPAAGSATSPSPKENQSPQQSAAAKAVSVATALQAQILDESTATTRRDIEALLGEKAVEQQATLDLLALGGGGKASARPAPLRTAASAVASAPTSPGAGAVGEPAAAAAEAETDAASELVALSPRPAAQSIVAAVPAVAPPPLRARASFDELFENHPWRVLIVRPAAKDLAGLHVPDKEAALHSLARLAMGIWSGHDVKHLSGQTIPSELSLYESKFGKGARIIWTVGIDFVPMVGLYSQTIRVWAVDRSHDDAQRSIERVCKIHRRGLTSVLNRKLKSRVQRVKGTDVVLPKTYQVAPDGAVSLAQLEQRFEGGAAGSIAGVAAGSVALAEAGGVACSGVGGSASGGAEEHTVRYPPAVEQEDAFNLVKFYTLERSLVWSILAATFTEKLEFPFLPDEAEHLIISLTERRSILLIGRSGTGKTTIVVQRMWLQFRTRIEALQALQYDADAPSARDKAAGGDGAGASGGEAAPVAEAEKPASERGVGVPAASSAVSVDAAASVDAASSDAAASMHLHQLFVTANPILRTSVAKSFKALQSGFVESMREAAREGCAPESAHAAAAALATTAVTTAEADAELGSLDGVPEGQWPLFLRSHHWLRLLDGTLPEARRFFREEERAQAAAAASGWHAERGGLAEIPELFDEEEDDVDDDDDAADDGDGLGAEGAGGDGGAPTGGAARGAVRVEMTFDLFERVLWPLMVGKGMPGADDGKGPISEVVASKDLLDKVRRAPVKASLVFREIVSYIKGSSAALDSADGRLKRAAYLSVGKKMAPAFEKVDDAESGGGPSGSGGGGAATVGRELVYDLFLKYEAWKECFGAYDVMDATYAIYSALREEGYSGPRLDEVYVDEVQDFTQAELRLFLEVPATAPLHIRQPPLHRRRPPPHSHVALPCHC